MMPPLDPGDDPPRNATGPSAETPEPVLNHNIGNNSISREVVRQVVLRCALAHLNDADPRLVAEAVAWLKLLAARGCAA